MTVTVDVVQNAEILEQVLGDLMQVEKFEPPAQFRASAQITDPDVYAEANRDPEAYWAGRARELHWHRPFTTVLDDSNPPFFKWFPDGELNVSYNCLDRHIEAGNGRSGCLPLAWRGGRAARDHVCRPAPRCAAPRERAEGSGRDEGRRRGDLPAHDS